MLLKVKYACFTTIIFIFFIVELITGIITNSISLQTDAFHMLSDMVALLIGFIALLIIDKKHSKYTYGLVRAEIIAGLINSVFLASISFTLLLEIIERVTVLSITWRNPELVENIDNVLIVGGIGLAINIIGILLFCNEHHHHHHHHNDSNDSEIDETESVINYSQVAVFLHILGDTFGSIVVMGSSLTIKFVGQPWTLFLDPLGSLVILIGITISSIILMWKCIKILMHKWEGENIKEIEKQLTNIEKVENVHEFHVFHLNANKSIAHLHLNLDTSVTKNDLCDIILSIKQILHKNGIHSSCIQPEWGNGCIEPSCTDNCPERQCCTENV